MTDDEFGMAWWNALDERERAEWSRKAGNTGYAKDAWEAFKRASDEELRDQIMGSDLYSPSVKKVTQHFWDMLDERRSR